MKYKNMGVMMNKQKDTIIGGLIQILDPLILFKKGEIDEGRNYEC